MSLFPKRCRSELAERILYLDGAPFSLADYPFFRAIYDGRNQGLLMKTARQVAKSTTLCNFTICESIGMPHFRTLFIAPSQEQTQRFSNTRLAKVVHYSPLVRRHFITSAFTDRTMLRMFKNGSEVTLTYACDNPDRARGVTADRNCFDKDAQVLTRSGWTPVSELTEADLVADVDDAGVVQWAHPTHIFTKKHTGEMVTFSHRGMHLRVTDDHNMWINFRVKNAAAYKQPDQYEFAKAIDLATMSRMGFKTTCRAEWLAERHNTQWIFNDQHYHTGDTTLCVPIEPFAELVGWYLAEGHTAWRNYGREWRCPRPHITQNPGPNLERIQQLVKECGIRHRTNTPKTPSNTVTLVSDALGYWLAELGLCRDKYIPREFFAYPHALHRLLYGLYKGDASYHEGERWDQGTLRTRSRRLASDTQEAWLRLGRPAVIHTREMEGEPLYEVCAYKRDYQIFWRADFEEKERVTTVDVDDEDVWCFTVPHHRPIVKGSFGSIPLIAGQCFDEVQDILFDAVIPVINECMANSKYAYETYAGTPKTMENTIEYLWSISTQHEWIIPCSGCGRWNFIESVASIGKTGPICLKCKKELEPRDGQWYAFNPSADLTGFHISQPMLPLNREDPDRWKRLLIKLDRYSETKFKNEVLGISDALGARLLSKQELEDLCVDYDIYRQPPAGVAKQYSHVVAGIDWSGGGTEGVSRTVLWLFGITKDHKLKTLYFRIYPVTNPVSVLDDIVAVLKAYGVNLIAGDRGEGHLANNLLAKAMGQHRVVQIHYGNQASPITRNDKGGFYTVDRTTLMDNYFMVLKRKGVLYPRLSYMTEPIKDVLNIYEEVTNQGKKVWRHAPSQPDDCFHAQLFGWLAAKILLMDLEFTG